MKPHDEGKQAFKKGKLGNPYPTDTRSNRDWEYGFNIEYFKNLERVKERESTK
jgi:hypothetical protein|tara:strand:+ start:518 stop:676 length:159 start_codon:yes stop_codon:yes gene_type:complete